MKKQVNGHNHGHGVSAEQFSLLRQAATPFLVFQEPRVRDSAKPIYVFGSTLGWDDVVPPHLLESDRDLYRFLSIRHLKALGDFHLYGRVSSLLVPDGREEYVPLSHAWPIPLRVYAAALRAEWDATRTGFPLEELVKIVDHIMEVKRGQTDR